MNQLGILGHPAKVIAPHGVGFDYSAPRRYYEGMNEHTLASVDRMMSMAPGAKTGGMVALLPRADQAEKLAVAGLEDASELHVTLVFLGEGANYDAAERLRMQAFVSESAMYVEPLVCDLWAVAQFNPHTADTATVYLVGHGPLENAKNILEPWSEHIPEQHRPWVPHMTIGYHTNITKLEHVGSSVTFDRVRLAFAGEYFDYPLTGKPGDDYPEDVAESPHG